MFQKRGIFFTIDAIIAAGIILIIILYLSQAYIREPRHQYLSYVSQDTVETLGSITLESFNNEYTQTLIDQGVITRPNNTILEQIGEFWAEDEIGLARNYSEEVIDALVPGRFGVGVYVNGEEIYVRNKSITRNLISSRKIITGIAKDKPTLGFSSRAFLKKIDSKINYAYAYFGGFVGQGNITEVFEGIPSDAVFEEVILEAEAGSSFSAYINDVFCSTLAGSPGNMTAASWNLSACAGSFIAGSANNITLKFAGLLNESYIGGGYVRVKYISDDFASNQTVGSVTHNMPHIKGLINLFSGVAIPGTLQSLGLYIHFYNNRTTYLNVGNSTIFTTGGSSQNQFVNISSFALPMSATTIPIRIGTRNISESINITSGEPSDSLLVTDVSGSMSECALSGIQLSCTYNCYWWFLNLGQRSCPYIGACAGDQCNTGCSGGLFSTTNHAVVNQSTCLATKMDLAKQADLLFVDTILNISGNRVGLDSFSTNVVTTEPLTTVKANLQSDINAYSPNGGTCVCCGINQAKDMLAASSTRKFLLVMTDGEETRWCNDFNDYTGSSSAPVDAIDAGQNACNLNITVFAVGFGADANQDVLKQVACNTSYYYNASNVSMLSEIYQEIGQQILIIANYSSQIVTVTGDFQPSTLFADSFVSFDYVPDADASQHGEIELTRETAKFNNCTPSVTIPLNTRIVDAKVVSYSGAHWTSYVAANGNTVFNISTYGSDFRDIGDPFVVRIPPPNLQNGANQLELMTADSPTNTTGCSLNNSMIYTIAFSSSVDYGAPLASVEGCEWSILLQEGGYATLDAPNGYSGLNRCYFNNTGFQYNINDTYDVAVANLLDQLDFDDNGALDVNFDSDALELEYVTLSNVPSLWGPALIEIRVWE